MIKISKILTSAGVMLFILTYFSVPSIAQLKNYTLTITMEKDLKGQMAFLLYTKPGEKEFSTDSVKPSNNKFIIKGTVTSPRIAYLYVERANSNFKPEVRFPYIKLYLEKGNILIAAKQSINSGRLSGTPLNNDLQALNDIPNKYKSIRDSLERLVNHAHQTNRDLVPSYRQGFNRLDTLIKQDQEALFYKNKNSLVSLDWLSDNVNIPRNKMKATRMFQQLSQEVKTSEKGKNYQKRLENTLSIEIGGKAPDFQANDILGKPISLEAYKGKYVLLDFWASWCVPCRKENPNLINAYQNLKNKNFTIISFSLDDNKSRWAEAVKKDALPWTQLSDLMAVKSPVVAAYGVVNIPSNFLIDPNGKIIAKDLRGDSLSKILESYVN